MLRNWYRMRNVREAKALAILTIVRNLNYATYTIIIGWILSFQLKILCRTIIKTQS